MRDLPVEALQKGAKGVVENFNKVHPAIDISGPVIDDLIPDYTWNMIAKGNAAGVNCLMGTCQNEGGLCSTS